MRKLRVVGSSKDNTELILSVRPSGRGGTHAVAIDKKLLAVLQKAVYARRDAARRERAVPRAMPEPKIPPREIQRRLRAGMSPADVAKGAGVDEAYVDQFLTPVLYERGGVVQDAQSMYVEKPRLGESSLPLGDAVAHNLSSRRVRMPDESFSAAWTATRLEGEPWLVSFTFPFRGRQRTAKWRFDQRTRVLAAANKLATDVGWVPNGKRAAARVEALRERATVGARGRGGKRPPEVRAPATRKKPARRKPTARRKPVRKPVRKTTARRKTTPRRKPATRRASARKPARKRAAGRTARRRAGTSRRRR